MDSDSDFSPESIHYKIDKLLFKMNNLIRVVNRFEDRFENIERQLLVVEKKLNNGNEDDWDIEYNCDCDDCDDDDGNSVHDCDNDDDSDEDQYHIQGWDVSQMVDMLSDAYRTISSYKSQRLEYRGH